MSADLTSAAVFLFVPADRPERFAKAAGCGADALVIDLEDSVAPDAKAAARSNLIRADIGLPIVVRINAFGTPWAYDDIAALQDLPLAGLMLPKTSAREDVQRLRDAGGDRLAILPLIESATGLAGARAIARAPGVIRLVFGSMDYSADLGCAHSRDALLAARSEMVLASSLAGLEGPVDGITPAIDRSEEVEADARYAASLGFTGKLCIHPAQVGAAMKGLAPSATEVQWAEQIMAADAEGAVRVAGAMVDAPIRARARRILARCRGRP